MASFIVDSCRDQRFSLETWDGSKNDRLWSMHTSDHRRSVFRIKISGFTPSYEALGRLLKKKKKKKKKKEEEYDDENSDFAYERFLVWRDEGS